jgi:hypothetical protein
MTTNVLPKPEDILWPVTERTIEAINFNFDLLFRDLASVSEDVVDVVHGGTGQTAFTKGDLLYASDTDEIRGLRAVAAGNVLLANGANAAPVYGKVGLTTHVEGILPVVYGGTNLAAYVVGDLLYASAVDALSRLADIAVGNVLLSGGVGAAPSYGKVGLTTHVSGILPIANGGTNAATAAEAFTNLSPTTTKGDLVVDDGTTPVRLAVGVTDGHVLTVDAASAAGVKWAAAAGGSASPLTTKGDLYTFDSANARLGVGADGTVLTADAATTTGLKWAAPAAGVGTHDLMDGTVHSDVDSYLPTKGRLLVGNDVNKWTVLERGSDGALLMVDSTLARGVKWTSISGEPHALLSSTHTDVDAAAVASRGSIIYGKATTTGGSDPFFVDGGQMPTLQSDSVSEQDFWADGEAELGFQSSTIGSSSTVRWAVLPIGVTGRALRSDGVDLYWGTVSGIEEDLPLSAKGDLLGHDGATLARLPVGDAGYVLSVDLAETTGLKWVAPSSFASPLTTKGDLYGYTTEDARVPVGTNGYVLTADSAQAAGVGWQAPATALLTTKGDLLTRTGVTTARLPVGSNGDALVAASGASEGLAWAGFIRARVSRTVNVTLPDATETTIDFTVEEYDSHNIHDNSTNPSRLTIPSGGAGTYLIVGQGSFAAAVGGRRAVWIFVNGSRVGISEGYTDTPSGSPLGFTIQATAVLALAVGDYIQLRLRQDSGVDDTCLATGPDLTALQCIRLTTG